MTDETTTTDAPAPDSIQISIEQILASILSLGSFVVPLENLIANYGNKQISVDQDPDTKAITFGLVDIPAQPAAEAPAETEQESE